MTKISLIGAGQIGSNLALFLAQKNLGEIVLLDINAEFAQGKALDLMHSFPVWNNNSKIIGTNDYTQTKNSDLYIVTAGIPRKPGMSRDDLLKVNAEIIKNVAENIKKYSPQAFVIVVTNPLDTMAQLMQEVTGFAKNKVIGMAGVLDSARFQAFLALETGIPVNKISTVVLGGHGDTMVPLIKHSKIKGKSISEYVPADKLEKIIARVKNAGGEIVALLKTGSAYYSPAAAAVAMAEAILTGKKLEASCSVYLNGEYGLKGCYMGVPVILGKLGLEKIIELELTADEKDQVQKSFAACRENVNKLKELLPA